MSKHIRKTFGTIEIVWDGNFVHILKSAYGGGSAIDEISIDLDDAKDLHYALGQVLKKIEGVAP